MPASHSYRPEKLYPVAEAAQLFGCPVSTLRKWIHQRRIVVCRLGRSIRIAESQLLQIQREGLQPLRGVDHERSHARHQLPPP